MARPRGAVWLQERVARRLKARIANLGALAQARQIALFAGDRKKLVAVRLNANNVYRRVWCEANYELIGVYGPGLADGEARMLEDCKAAGLL